MAYIPIPPVYGPPQPPQDGHTWEGNHYHVWDEYEPYEGKYKYFQITFECPPPFDRGVSGTVLEHVLNDVFFEYLHEGGPLRSLCWYRADRQWGIPYMWHYAWHIEYHESPALPVAAVLAALSEVLILAIVFAVTFKIMGTGVIDKVGGSIIVPSVMGITLIFVMGIGFIYFLSKVGGGSGVPISASTTAPRIPGMPKTTIGVGRAGAAARRRG